MNYRVCLIVLALLGLWAAESAPAQVVYSNDFEDPIGYGLDEWGAPWWMRKAIPAGGGQFLGEFGETTTATLGLTDLPDHGEITVSFDLFIIRSWDGNQPYLPGSGRTIGPDIWSMAIDGQTVIRTTFANTYADPDNPGSPGVGFKQAYPGTYVDATTHDEYPNQTGTIENYTLGYWFYGPLDSVYHMSFTVPHTANSVAVAFSSILPQRVSDESWGLDNVVVSVSQPFILVDIDIKPGTYPNSINLGSNGLIPVAILSSADFDATTVDETTVELAGARVAIRGKNHYLANAEDVNGDGLPDLVCHVETKDFSPDTSQDGFALVTGQTFDGQQIEGWDEISLVPPE